MLHNKRAQISETYVIGKRFSLPSLGAGGVGGWLRQQQPAFSAPSEMGPGTLGCSAWSWTNISFGNKIQRNYKGLKIAVCVHNWDKLGKIRNKNTKKKKQNPTTNWKNQPNSHPTAMSKELGAKAGYCSCPLHTTPPKGWANHLSRPSDLTHGHTATLALYRESACPPSPPHPTLGANKGTCCLFLLPLL